MVDLVVLLLHGVDVGAGPELQQGLQQEAPQVHWRTGSQPFTHSTTSKPKAHSESSIGRNHNFLS